jgi:hypothetical protein
MDFSSPNIVHQGNKVFASYGDDSGLHVVFDVESIPDPERSASEGRACFKDIEVITIHIAGGDVRHRPVIYDSTPHQPSDPERFPRQWAAFKNKSVQSKEGTPLEEWPPLSKSQVYELKAINIFTVEDLAQLPDGRLTWMGARDLQNKAKNFIESAKSSAPLIQLQEENAALKRDMEALKKQFEAIASEKAKKSKGKVDEDIS